MRVTTYRPRGPETSYLRPLTPAEGAWPDVPDPAGEGDNVDPRRANPLLFVEALRRWGFNLAVLRDPDERQALWRVVLRVPERRKMTRALRGPSSYRATGARGFRIRVFGAVGQSAGFRRSQDLVVEGPVFRLTYADAGRLWRDKDMRVTPVRDQIAIGARNGG